MKLEGLSVFCQAVCPNEFSGDCATCAPAVRKKHPAPVWFFFLGGEPAASIPSRLEGFPEPYIALMSHSLVI